MRCVTCGGTGHCAACGGSGSSSRQGQRDPARRDPVQGVRRLGAVPEVPRDGRCGPRR